jgi:hypothetical protein
MMSSNVIQLRQMLSERFPGARMGLQKPFDENNFWATGIPQMDNPLRGGLPKGALTEIVTPKSCSGSATLIRNLLSHAARQNQIIAFIDGNDSLDVTQMGQSVLSRMLWVRCRDANKTLQAADLVLRDNNFPIVLLDLKSNPESQLRKIPSTSWYRFQRLVEETATVCLIFTPHMMVSPAQVRITCHSRFSLNLLENSPAEILSQFKLEVFDRRQFNEAEGVSQSVA